MPWDDGLSLKQREYAAHPARILRLVAGPGTGKTRVITRRVGYLVEDQQIDPRQILALTFSRAAAGELRQRLEAMLGQQVGDRPSVYTLHAFALRQLLLNKEAPNLPHPIRIADDYDERWVVCEGSQPSRISRSRRSSAKFQNLASDWGHWKPRTTTGSTSTRTPRSWEPGADTETSTGTRSERSWSTP